MVARLLDFLRRDLWRMRLDDMSRSKFFLFRWLRIVVLAVVRGRPVAELQHV